VRRHAHAFDRRAAHAARLVRPATNPAPTASASSAAPASVGSASATRRPTAARRSRPPLRAAAGALLLVLARRWRQHGEPAREQIVQRAPLRRRALERALDRGTLEVAQLRRRPAQQPHHVFERRAPRPGRERLEPLGRRGREHERIGRAERRGNGGRLVRRALRGVRERDGGRQAHHDHRSGAGRSGVHQRPSLRAGTSRSPRDSASRGSAGAARPSLRR
jgi:hypothetical protein